MKGVNLGMQRGKLEGKLEGLAYLLRLRFGTMPDWVEARLSEASEEQLMDWMGRILRACARLMRVDDALSCCTGLLRLLPHIKI